MRKRVLLLLGALAMLTLAWTTTVAAPASPVLNAQPMVHVTPAPPLSAEDKALAAVEESGRQTVAILLAQLNAATQPDEIRALERRIESAKLAQQADFLRTKIRFATARGDQVTVDDANRLLRALLEPPAPAPAAPVVNGPEKPAPPKGDGR